MSSKRTVIYIRTDLVSAEATKAQHDACIEFCQRFSLDVVGTLLDIASGATLDERPKLAEMREMVAAQHVDVVVVYSLDRLARVFEHLAVLAREAEAKGVEVYSVVGSASGELTTLQVLAQDRERERLARLMRHTEPPQREWWECFG